MVAHKLLVLFFVAACLAATPKKKTPVRRGEQDVDPQDQKAQAVLQKAIQKENSKPKSKEEQKKFQTIIKATMEVTRGGTKYNIDFMAEGLKSKKQYQCHTDLLVGRRNPQVKEYSCQLLG